MLKYGFKISEITKELGVKRNFVERIKYKISFVNVFEEYNEFLDNEKYFNTINNNSIIRFGKNIEKLIKDRYISLEASNYIKDCNDLIATNNK